MSTMRNLADDCVAALVKAFPIEDVWLLEAKAAKECALQSPINLFLIVPDVSEAHAIESAALEMVRKRPEWSDIDVFAFPLSVITRIPRPLLVKMALTSGRNHRGGAAPCLPLRPGSGGNNSGFMRRLGLWKSLLPLLSPPLR